MSRVAVCVVFAALFAAGCGSHRAEHHAERHADRSIHNVWVSDDAWNGSCTRTSTGKPCCEFFAGTWRHCTRDEIEAIARELRNEP